MSNVLKFSGPIKVGSLASAPANPEVGFIYYDTGLGKYQLYNGTGFVEPADFGQLADTANGKGASLVSIEDAATQFTSTNVEGALTESLDAAQAAQADITAHENGGVNKHDATEVDYERVDGSKKNIQAASDDVETALTDLDDAVGALAASPTNYTPSDASIVADHLAGIDSALATAGGTEFEDSTFRVFNSSNTTAKVSLDLTSVTPANTRNITIPDNDVDLGDIAAISTNTNHVNGDGSDHADVATNTSHSSGDGSDHADVATNSTFVANAQLTTGGNGAFLIGFNDPSALYASNDVESALSETMTQANQGVSDAATAQSTANGALQTTGGTMTGAIDMGSSQINNLADGTVSTDAVTKSQLDAVTSTINNFEWQASALDYVIDNTAVPATEVSGDRYILSHDGGAPHANWDGASAGDIVEFDGALWVATTPTTGTFIAADDEPNSLYLWGGAAWAAKAFEQTTASLGLTKSGFDIRMADVNSGAINVASGVISANVDDSTIEKAGGAGNPLQVKDGGITSAKLASNISALKIADGTVTDVEFQYINSLTSNAQTQLTAKLENVVEDTTPQLGGDLDTNAKVILHDTDGVKRANSASAANFIEEEYIHAITLLGSQTDTVIADLTFAHASFEGMEIVFKLKEATSNDTKIGTIRVATNGSAVAINEMSVETADTGISFSAVVNGANINIRYSSGTNGATMRADVKRMKA